MSDPSAIATDESSARYCVSCGYDLRGITSDRCPECGELAVADPGIIPWALRRRIGYFRAFYQTVRLVTFRPKQLALAMGGPIDYAAAERFRLAVVLLAGSSVGAAFAVMAALNISQTPVLNVIGLPDVISPAPQQAVTTVFVELSLLWAAGAALPAVLAAGTFIALLIGTAVVGHCFHPRSLSGLRQDRAIAVSRYACASLAWLPIWALCVAVVAVAEHRGAFDTHRGFMFSLACLGICIALPLVIFGFALSGIGKLMRLTTHCGWLRVQACQMLLTLTWIGALLIGLWAIPIFAGLVRMILRTRL
jgi:hypothetical protein